MGIRKIIKLHRQQEGDHKGEIVVVKRDAIQNNFSRNSKKLFQFNRNVHVPQNTDLTDVFYKFESGML